jgi:mRNA interferase MazF
MERKIMRGDMYYADLSPVVGSEQDGLRPVVVIQNNIGNKYSPTIVIAAVTSKITPKIMLPTHIRISAKYGIEKDSVVLLEQIRTIDRKRLEGYIGTLDTATMMQINKALAISVGLIECPVDNMKSGDNVLELCLCSQCARQFYELHEHFIRRLDYKQLIKDKCDYCGFRMGFDFVITHSKKGEAMFIFNKAMLLTEN